MSSTKDLIRKIASNSVTKDEFHEILQLIHPELDQWNVSLFLYESIKQDIKDKKVAFLEDLFKDYSVYTKQDIIAIVEQLQRETRIYYYGNKVEYKETLTEKRTKLIKELNRVEDESKIDKILKELEK